MKPKLVKLFRDHQSLLLFLLLMFIGRSAVADWNHVPTSSMTPTIMVGDRIWVNKMAYDIRLPFTHVSLQKLADPRRGDIVVFDSRVSGIRLVKRVVGMPGDTVAMKRNVLLINDEPLSYSNAEDGIQLEDLGGVSHAIRTNAIASRHSSFDSVRVPPDSYLVLGDNRDNSADSRVIGFVPRAEIVGRARHVVMSFNYDNYYLPRPDRYLQQL